VAIVVLDASVVIAFLDRADTHHGAAVEALGRARLDELAAYAETLVDLWRRDPMR